MYVVLTHEEYDKLVCETGALYLYKDRLENELTLKDEDIRTYMAVGSKDMVNSLKNERAGMSYARNMLLDILKG